MTSIVVNDASQLEELEARMARFIEEVDKGIAAPNCRGTLLYLLGERDREYFDWKEDITILLQRKYALISDIPQANDLAVWHDIQDSNKILHAGLVVQDGMSLLIRSRVGPGWEFPIKDLTPSHLQTDLDGEYHGKSVLRYYRLATSKKDN